MSRFRTAVKLTFALLAVWLGLVWAGLLPRPAILPPELDIEPLTFLLGTIAALLFGFWKNNDSKSEAVTDSHPVTPADESLQTEIRKYLKSRYEHRIRQKLAGREPVNLRKIPSSTGTSDEGAQNFITLPAEKVPSGMAELFDEARGRLLVVGAPGAGKTTLLLQLALALLERAEKRVAHLEGVPHVAPAIPVLLNLATWRSEFATFDDWLQRILPLELGASKALAEKIRRNTPLVLLLDGLDEVPEDARASCLKAIGEYGAEAKHRFVISSRIAEYAATEDVKNVYLEVEVQPLAPQQVIDNLTAYVFHQPEAKPLLNALQTDLLLREAMANPFYLNTAQLLFATGRKYSDFGFAATDVAGRQRELVERFVENALERKVKREYPKEKARKWLGFLAGKMEEEKNVRFELVDLQPEWWINGNKLALAEMLAFGCVIVLMFFDTYIVLIPAILMFVIKFLAMDIKPTERIEWSKPKWEWKQLPISRRINLVLGIGIGVVIAFAILYAGYIRGRQSFVFSLYLVLVMSFVLYLLQGVKPKYYHLLRINHPYERFTTSLIRFESTSYFQHFILRFLLFVRNSLPLRFVTFLNEMSLRHLLEFDGDPETGKGGGSWRWRHRIIQEYFLEKKD